jgi:beta-lactamase regulating signal transducer with metallopeptidase domain
MDTLVHVGLLNAAMATGLALLAAAARFLRRPPALVHALWLLVLLKLVTPPFLTIPIGWLPHAEPKSSAQEFTSQPGIGTVGREEPLPHSELFESTGQTPPPGDTPDEITVPPRVAASGPEFVTPSGDFVLNEESSTATAPLDRVPWEMIVAAIWLSGSILWWSVAGYRLCRFRLLLRSASPAPPALQQRADQMARRLGLPRCPRVYLLPAPVTPLLWAVAGVPCLLIPAVLWARLTAQQQDTLLAHELAHLRRGDPWMRRLEIVILGLYWWHPVVWWARNQIQEAEEQCCDAWVLWALPAAAEAYAAALLETVAYLSRLRPVVPLGASGAGQTYLLRRRLTMILQGTTPRTLSRTGVVALLACGAVCLPLGPTWGQPPAQTAPSAELPALAQTAPANVTAPQAGVTPAAKITTGVGINSDAALTASIVHPRDVEEVKDAIELLQVHLEGKKAELLEARALVEQVHRQLDRQAKLRERGAIGEEEVEQTRTEVAVRGARLQVKQAQIKEVEVRLSHAKRLLSRLQSGPQHQSGTGSSSSSGATTTGSGSSLANPLTTPANSTTTAGALSGQPSRAKTPLDKSAASTGTSSTQTGYLNTPGKITDRAHSPVESEQRIRNLEQKLERLIDQVDALRGEIRRQRSGGEGASTPDPFKKPATTPR